MTEETPTEKSDLLQILDLLKAHVARLTEVGDVMNLRKASYVFTLCAEAIHQGELLAVISRETRDLTMEEMCEVVGSKSSNTFAEAVRMASL